VSYYDAFVATMQARFADVEELMRVAADAAMGAADRFAAPSATRTDPTGSA